MMNLFVVPLWLTLMFGGVSNARGCYIAIPPDKIDVVECEGVEIVPRKEWGARPSRENDTMPTPVPHLFIHHTAGVQCDDFESCARVVRSIQDFHMDDRKWDDIGYNFLIGGDGRVYKGRGWTRVGAHTYGFNTISIAYSLLGNFMVEEPSEKMLNTTENLIRCAENRRHVTEGYKLHGHRDAGCTSCPGDAFYAIIKKWPRFQAGPLPGSKCWRPKE